MPGGCQSSLELVPSFSVNSVILYIYIALQKQNEDNLLQCCAERIQHALQCCDVTTIEM